MLFNKRFDIGTVIWHWANTTVANTNDSAIIKSLILSHVVQTQKQINNVLTLYTVSDALTRCAVWSLTAPLLPPVCC